MTYVCPSATTSCPMRRSDDCDHDSPLEGIAEAYGKIPYFAIGKIYYLI